MGLTLIGNNLSKINLSVIPIKNYKNQHLLGELPKNSEKCKKFIKNGSKGLLELYDQEAYIIKL